MSPSRCTAGASSTTASAGLQTDRAAISPHAAVLATSSTRGEVLVAAPSPTERGAAALHEQGLRCCWQGLMGRRAAGLDEAVSRRCWVVVRSMFEGLGKYGTELRPHELAKPNPPL